jgi:hypothetical protein
MMGTVTARRLYDDVAQAYGLTYLEAKALVFAAAYGDRTAHLLMDAALLTASAARGEL